VFLSLRSRLCLGGEAVLTAQNTMEFRARLFAFVLGVTVLLFVVNLVRTKKLKEEFALLWLLTAVVLVLTPLFIDYLDLLAHALGIEYPPALIFLLAIISLLLILFQFSTRISRFSEQIKILTQEQALLRAQIEDLERAAKADAASRRLVLSTRQGAQDYGTQDQEETHADDNGPAGRDATALSS